MSNAFDTSNAPTTEPTEIVAGDYINWKRTDLSTDYPNDQYTLRYAARLEGTPARKMQFDAAADGVDYLVERTSAQTEDLLVGEWYWTAYIVRNADSARVSIDNGTWVVKLNSEVDASDPRSLPKMMLAHIEAAMLHRAENHQLDVIAYQMDVEVSATRKMENLIRWREYWKKELIKANRKVRARKGQKHSGTIRVKF